MALAQNNFENLPVRQAVLKQIIPALVSQMIVLIYHLADTYFVGLLNDPKQVAAVTIVGPIFLLLTAISNLFGVGGASAVARALGRKEPDTARQISSVTFWGGIAIGILACLAFPLCETPILKVAGATSETYDFARDYANWVITCGGIFTVITLLMVSLIRAEGMAAVASFGISLGGILNLILDPIFILPQFLNMGAAGAGAATAISNAISAGYFLVHLWRNRHKTALSLSPNLLKCTSKHIYEILSIGFPSAIQYFLTVVAVTAQAYFVSRYSTEAIAAWGIVKKLDQLPLYFSIGVAQGLLPLLAYNHASGNVKRRHDSFVFGCAISVGFSFLCLVCYELFALQLGRIFIENPTTVQYAASFLRRMVTAMPMMAVSYPMIIQFQAMGKPRESLICSILRKGVLDIPLLFLFDWIRPLYGCIWVQPAVDAIALCAVLFFYWRILESETKSNIA
ncbi:MAG: MATE family efflux transporter [Victivallales bacterium]|nr:MATE family efflux transporter [Victivallales bacterium]